MIKSNLTPSKKSAPQAGAAKYAGKKKPAGRGDSKKSQGSGFIGNFVFMLLLLFMAGIVYLEFFGIPTPLRGVVPPIVVEILGLSEESAATQVLREAGAPKLTAHGTKMDDPSVPMNGSVEEVVKTMRPDVYLRNKILTDYREQALSNRIPYQKQAFHIMLSTFYKATPDGVGYLDLAYQAPNFYFARVIAVDSRTRTYYMDQLRTKVMDVVMADSSTVRDGSVEFSVHGKIQQPRFSDLGSIQLVQPSKIHSQIAALRSLATANQVRLAGLERPVEESFGTHRRVILKTTTEADYPALLSFADALQKSDIPFGVQQFVSKPAGPEKMQSALEFVLYASMK